MFTMFMLTDLIVPTVPTAMGFRIHDLMIWNGREPKLQQMCLKYEFAFKLFSLEEIGDKNSHPQLYEGLDHVALLFPKRFTVNYRTSWTCWIVEACSSKWMFSRCLAMASPLLQMFNLTRAEFCASPEAGSPSEHVHRTHKCWYHDYTSHDSCHASNICSSPQNPSAAYLRKWPTWVPSHTKNG